MLGHLGAKPYKSLHPTLNLAQPPFVMGQIVKFLAEHRGEGNCTRFAMNGAAAAGNMEVVKVREKIIQPWIHTLCMVRLHILLPPVPFAHVK